MLRTTLCTKRLHISFDGWNEHAFWLFWLFLLLNKLVPFQPMGSSLCPAGSPSGIVINSGIKDWAFSFRQSLGPDSFTMMEERILTNIHYGHIGYVSVWNIRGLCHAAKWSFSFFSLYTFFNVILNENTLDYSSIDFYLKNILWS